VATRDPPVQQVLEDNDRAGTRTCYARFCDARDVSGSTVPFILTAQLIFKSI
jgi:hypothetical protein